MSIKEFVAEAERCSQCSYCKWIPFDQIKSLRFGFGCPSLAYNNFNSYSARGRYAIILSLTKGWSNYTDKVKDIVYRCLNCGSCDISCKICRYNLEPLAMTRELKAQLVEDRQTLPQHAVVIDSIKKNLNTMSKPKTDRGKWSEKLNIKDLNQEKANIVFHTGCRLSYDIEQQRIARTTFTLLQKAGVDFGIMGNQESCCGGRIYDMGYRREFKECAQRNIAAWKKAGVKMVVTSCADCYHAIKRLYPEEGSSFEVLHTVEYLAQLIKDGKLKLRKTVPMKITYHDPCHLGRQGEPYIPWQGREKKINNQIIVYEPRRPRYNGAFGVYDLPRKVLKSINGIELIEMGRIREYAWCCGAGGGVREAYPDFSKWTARERVEEAKATGAEAIVSACPWCEKNFSDVISDIHEPMKVFDITDLVEQAI
jgi:Fe-S oxidoreductase